MDESKRLIYWTRQPESALIGEPSHFRRRLHLFCVMTEEEARRYYKYDTYEYPKLEPHEIAEIRAYMAQHSNEDH